MYIAGQLVRKGDWRLQAVLQLHLLLTCPGGGHVQLALHWLGEAHGHWAWCGNSGVGKVASHVPCPGRHCGFIALHATLAARLTLRTTGFLQAAVASYRHLTPSNCENIVGCEFWKNRERYFLKECSGAGSVDICLLPEMDISLPRVLHHAMHLMKTKGHAGFSASDWAAGKEA